MKGRDLGARREWAASGRKPTDLKGGEATSSPTTYQNDVTTRNHPLTTLSHVLPYHCSGKSWTSKNFDVHTGGWAGLHYGRLE